MSALRARKAASFLLLFTLLYNVFEGIVALWSGVEAGSIVLVAFGADSYLEVAAAGAVLWRLSYWDDERGEVAERRALRFIGITFLILAAAVVFQSVVALAGRDAAEASPAGIAILAASFTLMPPLALAKLRIAARDNLPALASEARETLACSYLSATAFAGVVATAIAGWWWVDATAALALVPWLAREGLEAVRAQNCYDGSRPCSCRSCLFGLRACRTSDGCVPACC
ncbi:MAG: hypothetical protein Kow0010_14450 [Dehalococcoidia bacterium]